MDKFPQGEPEKIIPDISNIDLKDIKAAGEGPHGEAIRRGMARIAFDVGEDQPMVFLKP